MAWGGLEEQRKEQEAGNPHAKNWCNEALNIMKKTMQDYWDSNPAADPPARMETNISALEDNNTLESEFDHHCRSMVTQNIGSGGEGWATEPHRYLDDLPSDVTKDTNVIEWWAVSTNSLMFCMSLTIVQNHTNSYRTSSNRCPCSLVVLQPSTLGLAAGDGAGCAGVWA